MSDHEDYEEVTLRHNTISKLLQERDRYLQEIKVLKKQIRRAGITSFSIINENVSVKSAPTRYSLPLYGSTKNNGTISEAKRPSSCFEDGEILKRHSLTTYDKRSGTNDLGRQYEYIMCAFYAVRFATSEFVTDFEMTTNDKVYGDFDDIDLKVRYVDGTSHTYLFQLKHSENKKRLTEKVLATDKKDFNLMKYLKTFQKLSERDNVSCILFTNHLAHFEEKSQFLLNDFEVVVKGHEEVVCEAFLNTNRTSKNSVFQFSVSKNCEIGEFLDHFYIFANQQNVSKMHVLISELLTEFLQCDVYNSFIYFMKGWWSGNFVLTKSDVIAKLAELALSSSIRYISDDKRNKKSKLLEKAILKFDMTLVEDIDSSVVTHIWKHDEEVREVSLTALKYGLTNKAISSLKELTPDQKTKAMWYLNKVPLIIKVHKCRNQQVKCAIKLLEQMEMKKKLLLVGDFSKKDFPEWNVFDNLVDLSTDELYQHIVKCFEISLQGRDCVPLETLFDSPETAKIIKIRELFMMSQEPLLIGDKKVDLPEFYIPRTVSTHFLETEKVLLSSINSNDLLIMNCTSTFRDFLKTKNLPYSELEDYVKECEASILLTSKCTKAQFDDICRRTSRRRVHLLRILEDQSSILVLSSNNTLKSLDLQCQRKPIPEEEIHSVFDNPINVLCAQPGIGKSTMIKYLDNTCPSDYWSVRVNLRKFNSLLKEEPEEEEMLLHFLQLCKVKNRTLLEEVKMLFFESRKIYLFLDGLDEVESNCVEFALEYVKYIASTGVHVWISSRQNLQDVITNNLNIFPIDIQEVTHEEQRKFIQQRLRTQYGPDEIEQVSKEIFQNTDLANSHNVLGIPLQLYIITENFLNNGEHCYKLSDEIFVLTKMYRIFFEGKKKHLYKKVGVQYEQQLGFNYNHYLTNYEIPALRCCLDDKTFQKMSLEEDSRSQEFLELIKHDGDKFGIITQINESGAVFGHQTYAEYFACLWLKKNFVKARVLKDELKSEKYQNLRLIFDIMLAENSPLHLAVIYRNYDQIKKHLRHMESTDDGGRSALHLVCSYGTKHVPLQMEPSLFSNHLYHVENQFCGEINNYQEIFTSVSLCDPFKTDEVFKWDCLDYCSHFQCLYPIEKFLEGYKEKVKLDFLFDALDSVSLIYYSSKLGYPNLLEVAVKRNRTFVHYKIGEANLSFLHVAVKGVNEDGDASLTQKVATTTKIKIIKILIKNGIDVNVRDKNGASALHWAVRQGDYEVVKALLDEGADVNAISNEEETIVHYAVQEWEKQVKILKIYKNWDLDLNTKGKDGTTLLHWACKEGDYDFAKILVDKGVDVNVANKIGETSLHYAVRAWKPDLEIIKLLINSGVDVNSSDCYGISPLHWAFNKGHYDVIGILHQKGANITTITFEHKTILRESYKPLVPNMDVTEMIIDHGFNVNAKSTDGTSVLHWVSEKGHSGLVRFLMANGANINASTKNHETILHCSSRGWNPKIIKMFTEVGIDVNARDTNGTTAIHRAAKRGYLHMVEVLLEQGANIAATTSNGENVLHFAVKTHEAHLEVLRLLIQKGVDVNSTDQEGVSALHWACERGHYDVVQLLLDEGADVNAVTRKGETPLHFTSTNFKIIMLLLTKGVHVNAADVDQMTALHQAFKRGRFALAKILLESDANVNAVTAEQETVLIYAVKQRKINIEIINLIVKSGAAISASDKNGMNALHWASECGHYHVVKLLIEKEIDVNSCTNRGETALHYASKSWESNTKIIRTLVLSGIRINSQDDDGAIALHWASKAGHHTNVEILVELGADVQASTKNEETTLHYAAKAWKNNDNVLELLIDKGVNVNSVDREGKSALHWAAAKGFYNNVKLLLDKGATVDAVTRTNLTALHFAVYGGHVRIIKLLIKRGLNIKNIDANNASLPLYFATRNGTLKEELLVMMAATIHDKFPLLSWERYSYQEVITYLQETQSYLEPAPVTVRLNKVEYL